MNTTYKQSVKIGANITDIMCLPCVNACYKQSDKTFIFEIETRDFSRFASQGEWLCEDYNGDWHIIKDFNNI